MTLPIRTRLTVGFLCVLFGATLSLAGGTWWILRSSMVQAADEALVIRVRGTERFIDAIQNELPKEELLDEFREFAELTSGETLLEVIDDTGVTLCRPEVSGWDSRPWPVSASRVLQAHPMRMAGQPFRALSTDLTVAGHRYRVAVAISMTTALAAMARFAWLLAALVPAVLLLAAGGGFWLSRRALSPVDQMTRDARAISLHHLDRRLDLPGADDELRRLALTFNDLLERLQGAFEDMVRFTADASHELRTPVSIARTATEVSLARPRSADEYRETLNDVLVQTERMSRLVDDLLTLARADAGIAASDLDDLDLREVIREAMRDVAPLAAARGIRLDAPASDTPLPVHGGAESLRRLMVILLDNAVKYTPSGGAVAVRSFATAVDGARHVAILEVVDTGPGVSNIDRPRVFDRFYRGADARQVAADGSGLGLSIATTIVERHNGTITLDRGPDSVGCLVRVELPLVGSA